MDGELLGALEHGYSEPLRDPLWGHIYLTEPLAALVSSAPFQKLARIQQLGPTSLVYPGATHTRAAHSLGVYHLARRLVHILVDRGAGEWVTPGGLHSFLAAALLHDLGHFPYAHSLKELPLEDHEVLSGRAVLAEPLRSLVGRTGADPYRTAAIIDKSLPIQGDGETLFYRALLSGVLDPDKLDYLNRDARFCGVPYGAQDIDFTLSRLFPDRERGLTVDSRGILSIEALLFAKYLMYRSVYWHRDVRAATAMVKKDVMGALSVGAVRAQELYDLDDAGLFSLLSSRPHPTSSLSDSVHGGRIYPVVAEMDFDEDLESHRELADIGRRPSVEQQLADTLSAALDHPVGESDLVIDLSEPISFETGLHVRDEGKSFSESSTVFKGETVASFTRSLRKIRILLSPSLGERVKARPAALSRMTERYCRDGKNGGQ